MAIVSQYLIVSKTLKVDGWLSAISDYYSIESFQCQTDLTNYILTNGD